MGMGAQEKAEELRNRLKKEQLTKEELKSSVDRLYSQTLERRQSHLAELVKELEVEEQQKIKQSSFLLERKKSTSGMGRRKSQQDAEDRSFVQCLLLSFLFLRLCLHLSFISFVVACV